MKKYLNLLLCLFILSTGFMGSTPNLNQVLNAGGTATSAQLSGVLTNETGTGVFVLATKPTLTAPLIHYTATTYTASGTYTVTASELHGGLLVAATTTATTTMVMPSTASLATELGAVAGDTYRFQLINNGASNGTVTVAVGTGMTASDFPGTNTLTRTGSATVGIAGYEIGFISTSATTLTRIR